MSFLVELDRHAYPDSALDDFTVTPLFSLDNSRAMMWMSQLAYETANTSKVESILTAWHLTIRAIMTNDPVTGLPPHSACVVVAGGRGASMVSFAGTDPLKIEDWITDFSASQSATGLHSGFQAAVETVWPGIRTLIANPPPSEQALFFTGHSLGGALAIIAAERAIRESERQPFIPSVARGPVERRSSTAIRHDSAAPRFASFTVRTSYRPSRHR